MKNYLTIPCGLIALFSILTFFTSCKKTASEEIHFFSKYDEKRTLLEKDIIKFTYKNLNDSVKSILCSNKDSIFSNFEQIENNHGVFRNFSGKFRPYYFFDQEEIGGASKIFPPFINMEAWLIDKKLFKGRSGNYEVYHYEEISYCTPSISSFWVKNVGTIGYIVYDNKNTYIYICNAIEGNNINEAIIQSIKGKVVSDTSFFKRAKYLPCKL